MGDLPLRMGAVTQPGSGRTAHVPIAIDVELPSAGLQDSTGAFRGDLTYQVLAADQEDGKVSARTGRAVQFALRPRPGTRAQDTIPYQITTSLDLQPGRYQLRAGVFSRGLARGGSVYVDLDVPDFDAPLAVGQIVIGRGTELSRTPGAGLGGFPFRPVLDRTFAADETLRVYAPWRRSDRSAPLSWTIRLLAPDGRVLRTFSPVLPADDRPVDASVPLAGLPAGVYVLEITIRSGALSASRGLAFSVP